MEMTNFEMYNRLRPKLGDDTAQDLVTFVNATVKNEIMELKEIFMTKDDKVEIVSRMKEDKLDLTRTIYVASFANVLVIVATLVTLHKYLAH